MASRRPHKPKKPVPVGVAYPVVGPLFGAEKPKRAGEVDEGWGQKKFASIEDERVRHALVSLQAVTQLILTIQAAEKMPPYELARKAGVSLSTLHAVLRGDYAPPWDTLCALLTVLDIDLFDLDVAKHVEHRPRVEEEAGRIPWWPGQRNRR